MYPEKYKHIRNYFKFHLFTLKLFGVSIVDEINNFVILFLYRVYCCLIVSLVFYLYTASEAVSLYQTRNDIVDFTFMLCYFLTHFIGCLKITLVIINRAKIFRFATKIESGIFLPDMDRSGEEEFVLVADAVKICNYQAYGFLFIVFFIVTPRALYVFFDDGFDEEVYDPQRNATIIKHFKMMPFESYVPFDTNESPLYEMVSMYQLLSATFFGFVIAPSDAIICGMLVHVKCQFLILRNCLEKYLEIAARRMKNDGFDIDIKKYTNFKEPSNGTAKIEKIPSILQKYATLVIRDCVTHHQEILDLATDAEETFSDLMLVQILGTLIMLCFQLFQLTLCNPKSFRFLSMFSYLFLILFQLSLFCWHGNEVQLVSMNLKDVIYKSNWIIADVSMQKTLALMMERTLRPVRMTAGKFTFLSLETFMAILRGSASYFMVVRRMNEETSSQIMS